MNKVAVFEKVSYEQYKKDMIKQNRLSNEDNDGWLKQEWEQIKLPIRATVGSAGYDFYTPVGFNVGMDKWITIPTGIRCNIVEDGWFLMCCPKSGQGFSYRVKLANTIGVIDSDYYFSDNEGHIMARVSSEKEYCFSSGDKFMQGIFLPYGITRDDIATGIRNGGHGSTGK